MASNHDEHIGKDVRGAEQAVAEGKTENYEATAQQNKTAADYCLNDPERKRRMQKFEEAIVTDTKVSFDDVIGLDRVKDTLREFILLPIKFPQLFQGRRHRSPPILLYGPPGTGKTYLARAIGAEFKESTFIMVNSSDFVSRWRGNSEKDIQCLFDLACERQPCIVFLDDIDILCEQCNDSESESSRRVIVELCIQMQKAESVNVFIIAATNKPWMLTSAIRRRFAKHLYIPLPDEVSRAAIFKICLNKIPHTIKDDEWTELAKQTDQFSGADIVGACWKAAMKPVRRLVDATHFKRVRTSNDLSELLMPCSSDEQGAESLTFDKIKPEEIYQMPITMADMVGVLASLPPSVNEADLSLFEKFKCDYCE